MYAYLKDLSARIGRGQLLAMYLTGIGLIIASSLVWWFFVYQNTHYAFWDMVDNSLQTTGVTRQLDQKNGSTTLKQVVTSGYLPQASVRAETVLRNGDNAVTTETVATKNQEYVRYTAVDADDGAASQGLKNIVNKWASTGNGDNVDKPGLFEQSTFGLAGGNVLPIINLSPNDRKHMVETIRDTVVFEVSYNDVQKHTVDGRPIYSYRVKVQPVAYAGMQKTLAKMLGLTLFEELEPNQYQGQQATIVTMDVDAWSHRLTGVRYEGQDRSESYSAYNVVRKSEIPKTSLSTEQLQQAIGEEQQLE